MAQPLKCGDSLSEQLDVLVDRASRWNEFYRYMAQSAANSLVTESNSSLSFNHLDKHSTYDLLARAMHPKDRLPTTVLMPDAQVYSAEQRHQYLWTTKQLLIVKSTLKGWDPQERQTDWQAVESGMRSATMKMSSRDKL